MAIVELINRGGWMMWVILGISVVALAISLDRVLLLYIRSRLDVGGFLTKIKGFIEAGDYAQAMEVCNIRSKHPLPLVLKAGLSKANRREKEIERAMETEMLRALPRVQRGVGFLGLLGNTATLLGLLKAFSGVSAASASARQQVLAEGISMAMYTTAFGLIVAVPILFAHQLISGRMDNVLIQLEEGASDLLGSLAGRLKGAPGEPNDSNQA
jgi:biopolymer transport protein ExbB